MVMQLASCLKCKGDLLEDEGDWRCLQCGHYYYPKPAALPETDPANGQTWSRRPSGGVAGRNINSLIEARSRREARHPSVITYLKQGRTVQEIATLTGLSPRAIRSLREY